MSTDMKIESLRGSIFVPQKVLYSKELISNMEEVLPDFTPFIIPDPKTGDVTFGNTNYWCMCSNGNVAFLIFSPQKVDYIERKEFPFSEKFIKDFGERCKKVFKLILEYSGVNATRLAIAPTFKETFDSNEFINFISNKVYAINRFNDSTVEGSEFSQVFHRYEKIAEQNVRMNYLSKFYTRNDVKTHNEVYMLDFDINTPSNQNISFDIAAINDFYSKSPTFCVSFVELYFGNKQDEKNN